MLAESFGQQRIAQRHTLTLNLAITFSSSFAATENIYMRATDLTGGDTGWQARGSWTAGSAPTPPAPPPVVTVTAVSVTPRLGSGLTQSFTLQYSDSAGAASLATMWAAFSTTATNPAPSSCAVSYSLSTKTVTYRNAHKNIKYVGDAACFECHREISESYRTHSMRRSLYPIGEDVAEDQGTAEERLLFDWRGFQYTLQKRDGKTFHREVKRDAEGKVIGAVEGEVKYVLGSGTRAKAFLFERDGYLFQSPITWYAKARLGYRAGVRAARGALRAANHAGVSHLSREPGRACRGYRGPLSAADVSRSRHRLRTLPRAWRIARRAAARRRRRTEHRQPSGFDAGVA